ncbi:MAG: hypothetical protein ABI867_10165 [Kofleriaceae bacterium]
MAEGKRPGGLTALAVLNFVFAGLGLLGLLAVLALLTAADVASGGKLEGGGGVSKGIIYVALILGVVRMGILLAAGVGYLKMKRFLGRTLGNVYAILAIADTVIALALLKQGFGIGVIIGLIYPVLTLILLNTTFKDDLVN